LRLARAVSSERSLAIKSLSACETSTCALTTSTLGTVAGEEAGLGLGQEVEGQLLALLQIRGMTEGHENGVVGPAPSARRPTAGAGVRVPLGRPKVRLRHPRRAKPGLSRKGKGDGRSRCRSSCSNFGLSGLLWPANVPRPGWDRGRRWRSPRRPRACLDLLLGSQQAGIAGQGLGDRLAGARGVMLPGLPPEPPLEPSGPRRATRARPRYPG